MRIHAHGTGATVLELMVTLAIAAILVTTGVPSFQNYLLRQHVRAAVNQLHHDLMLARSEAVYRNAVVIACPGAPESGCASGPDWSSGWIVFEDGDGDRALSVGEAVIQRLRHVARLGFDVVGTRVEVAVGTRNPVDMPRGQRICCLAKWMIDAHGNVELEPVRAAARALGGGSQSVVAELGEAAAVEAGEPRLGADPQVAVRGLGDGADAAARAEAPGRWRWCGCPVWRWRPGRRSDRAYRLSTGEISHEKPEKSLVIVLSIVVT